MGTLEILEERIGLISNLKREFKHKKMVDFQEMKVYFGAKNLCSVISLSACNREILINFLVEILL